MPSRLRRLEDITTEVDIETANVRQMEIELRSTKERLQATTEELESSNEELRSSNEELSSINEELQSTNEELETSKEELQSINEELHTVNAELNARVEELSRAHNDMANLLESTQIATIFLDRDMLVQGFTPAAKDVFRLVESDTGRPLSHVRPRFTSDSLQDDAARVLRTLGTVERKVQSNEDDTQYVMRILPYRTGENVINGVVITFTDITQIASAQAQIAALAHDLRLRISSLETLLDLVPVGVLFAESGKDDIMINQYAARLLGVPDHRTGLRPASMPLRFFIGDWEIPPEEQPLQQAIRSGKIPPRLEGQLLSFGGKTVEVILSATPLLHDDGTVRGAIAAIVDISQRKRSEAQQHELQHRVKNILTTISSLATRMARGSPPVEEFHQTFLARLSAMGRTHDLLSGEIWEGARLGPLIAASLDGYNNDGRGSVEIDGPEVMLPPNVAVTLGMVLHELTTNAVKYGALGSAGGRVKVSWTVTAEPGLDDQIDLVWRERGGPPVDVNPKAGFGTGFVRRSVEYELEGSVALDLAPEGLQCRIAFPLPRMRGEA